LITCPEMKFGGMQTSVGSLRAVILGLASSGVNNITAIVQHFLPHPVVQNFRHRKLLRQFPEHTSHLTDRCFIVRISSSSSSRASPRLECSRFHELPPSFSVLCKSPCWVESMVEQMEVCIYFRVRSQVWRGRPGRRLQSLGSPRVDVCRALKVSWESLLGVAHGSRDTFRELHTSTVYVCVLCYFVIDVDCIDMLNFYIFHIVLEWLQFVICMSNKYLIWFDCIQLLVQVLPADTSLRSLYIISWRRDWETSAPCRRPTSTFVAYHRHRHR